MYTLYINNNKRGVEIFKQCSRYSVYIGGYSVYIGGNTFVKRIKHWLRELFVWQTVSSSCSSSCHCLMAFVCHLKLLVVN